MTGLDNIQAVKMYELIFYLHKVCEGNKKALRMLYKYQYFLTGREKQMNPNWGHVPCSVTHRSPVSGESHPLKAGAT